MGERKWLRVVELDVVKQAPGHTMVCILNSANFTVGTPFFVPDGYALDAPSDAWRVEEERDEARREAEELRAENERLREPRVSACPECGSSLCFDPRYGQLRWADPTDDQPAPQTHFRPGDLVLNAVGDPRRLRRLLHSRVEDGVERWESPDAPCGYVELSVKESPILERDGVPTDEGLRRLAERAGVTFAPSYSYGGPRVSWTDEHVMLAPHADRDDRRALAAALREMGGA